MFKLETELWRVIWVGWLTIIDQKASGARRYVPKSKLPQWEALYTCSQEQFNGVCRKVFHNAARR